MAGDLLVGAAKVGITPPLHVPYLGFEPRQAIFEGVHDPLYARAAAFDSEDAAVAVLSADALGLSRDLLGPGSDFIADVRDAAVQATGLAPECILLAATHAHSTPETYGITRLWERDDCRAWTETLADQLASAVTLAWQDRSPASLRLGAARLEGMSRNRREHLGGEGARHPIDESVTVLLAERESGGPVALASYACHPVTVQVQPLVSADFPGRATSIVEGALGGDGCCLFLQGAAGDINPILGHTGEWRDVETYGQMLAGGILEALGAARLADEMPDLVLAGANETLSLPSREAPSLEEASAALEATEARAAREAYRLAQFGAGPVSVEAQALRIGELTLCAFPGELFCELGLRLKAELQAPTMVVGCANGCVGYLPPEQAWDEGGYEVGMGAWCRLARGAPEELVEAARKLAGSL